MTTLIGVLAGIRYWFNGLMICVRMFFEFAGLYCRWVRRFWENYDRLLEKNGLPKPP